MVVSELIVDGQHQTNHKGKIISNINLNGVDYNFAERILVSGKENVNCYNSVNERVYDVKIYGDSVQNGIPSPDNPITIKSVGDFNESNGKYIIPIKTNNITTNIYLDEPLRKIGEFSDYIDFKQGKIFRNIEERPCKELAWRKHATYSNIYYVNSARLKIGVNPVSDAFDSTEYAPSASIANMKKDFCIKGHASGRTIYISDSIHTTLTEFENFISNYYVEYVLDVPEEQNIDLTPIETLRNGTLLQVETKINPSKTSVEYWKQIYSTEEKIIQTDDNIKIISTNAGILKYANKLFIGE